MRITALQWMAGVLMIACIFSAQPGLVASESEAAGLQVAGKPLGYWISQAGSESPSENLTDVVSALVQAVKSDDHTAKVTAADALAGLGKEAEAAVPSLIAQLDHEQPWVRSGAAGALSAVGEDAVPALIELFKQQVGGPSVRAAFILGSIGSDAKEAAPIIAEVMKDASEAMQVRYAGILNQIDPERYAGNQTTFSLRSGQVKLAGADSPGAEFNPMTAGWPQFHGPNRDSICQESGLLDEWPEGGPKLLWTLKGIGRGFSSVSISGGRMFTMGDRAMQTGEEAQYVVAYDLQTRTEEWAVKIGEPFRTGPRCTPTVAEGKVYALGTEGSLLCLEAETGKLSWSRDLPKTFEAKVMTGWKYCESPLVDGERVICTPGGAEAAMVALDRNTGALIWKCALPTLGEKGVDGAAYSSAIVATIRGVRQYVQMMGRGVVGIEAETGRFLWGYNRIACNIANITAPVVRGNHVFVTTAYNTGSALLEIVRDGPNFRAEEVYFLGPRDFQNHHGGIVLVDGHVYGGHRPNSGYPTCIDLATGKVCWSERSPARGSASVLYADGHVIFRYDRGEVVLVEASSKALKIKGRFTAVKGEGPAWAHPVIYQGKLYLRHGDVLACYDLRALEGEG